MAEQSLKQRTVKGMGWSAIDQVSRLGVQFIVGIILARLLSPTEYGLIGIVMVFITIFNAIVDSGFSAALIRKQNATSNDYNTVFIVNLSVSILMAAVFFALAKPISIFFERNELFLLTRAISCVVIINALCIVQRTQITKEVDFKTQTKISFSSSVLSGVLGIFMAYLGYGVWALVGQQISLAFFTTIFFWICSKWRPSFVFNIESFKELWGFGWKLLVVSIIDNAWKEIYQVVVGKCYTPATLGLYTRASQFSQMISYNINGVVQRVSYPILSNIQDDRLRLKSAYQRIIRATMLPTFVLMYGMAATAKPMVLTLLGEKWIGCASLLQMICCYGALYPLHALNLNMLQVQGRSDLILRLEIIKKAIMVGPILIGVFVNIYAMVGSSVLTSCICYYLNAYYSGPYLNYSIKDQIKDILPSFSVALAMAIPVYAMSYMPLSAYILFPLQVIAGAIITIILCEMKQQPEYLELKGIIMSQLNKIIKR